MTGVKQIYCLMSVCLINWYENVSTNDDVVICVRVLLDKSFMLIGVFYPIGFRSVSDHVIAFTIWPRIKFYILRLWNFAATWKFESFCCPSCNFKNHTVYNDKSRRHFVPRKTQYPYVLCRMHFSGAFIKISWKFCSLHTSAHQIAFVTSFLAYCDKVMFGDWLIVVITSSMSSKFLSVA